MLFPVFLLAWFVAFSTADVEFTSPTLGQKFTALGGKVSVPIKWKDSGDDDDQLSLANAKSYTILLCTGPNNDIQCLQDDELVSNQAISSKSYTASIPADLVPSGYFYFQIHTFFTDGSSTLNYSPRVQLQSMTGATSTFIATVDGSSPDGSTSLVGNSINSASFTIPYTLQTGKSKFAPMQTQPGSVVTATTWTRKYPASAVTYFSTKADSPFCVSTITPGWDYTPESAVNWATPAPFPTEFYPASDRVSSASLTGTKKKRWI
jgi:hypothetical protein